MGFQFLLHFVFPIVSMLYFYLLLKNKTGPILSYAYLLFALVTVTLLVLKESCYLCLLTSSLGILAIFSTQGFPPYFGILLCGGLVFLQKHFFCQLNQVYEPITDSYRINASSVKNAITAWFVSLALELFCFLVYQISFKNMWKNYQGIKHDLEKLNKGLLESNNTMRKTIDELKQINQELSQTLKSRDLFVAWASHELRNPLNVLLNGIEQLSSELKTPGQLSFLKSCQICGDILKNQVNNLLDASKLNVNKIDISEVPTKMSTFLDQIWSMASIGFEKKNLTGNLSVDKNVPRTLNIDSHHLQQILDNLISNAIKFTTQGSVRITVYWIQESQENGETIFEEQNFLGNDPNGNDFGCEMEEGKRSRPSLHNDHSRKHSMTNLAKFVSFKNRNSVLENLERNLINRPIPEHSYLRIDIVDTGCGIAEEEQDRIFDPFEQANLSIRRKYGGTGLGLYIVKKLVDKMGGLIKVNSLKDVGTRFQISLPIKNSPMNLN